MSVTEISPLTASTLANSVYSLNSGDKLALRLFLTLPVFSQKKNHKKQMEADVGGRLLKSASDMFGVCAVGSGAYANDIFLVFRGTTTANNKADFVTDARIGLNPVSYTHLTLPTKA